MMARTVKDDIANDDPYRVVCNRLERTIRTMTTQIEYIRRETPERYYGSIFDEVPKAGWWVVSAWRRMRYLADKVSASLASTGTPSYFVIPSEAEIHFPLVGPEDRILMFHRSGIKGDAIAARIKVTQPDVPIDVITDHVDGWPKRPGVILPILAPEPINPATEREVLMLAVGDSLVCGLEAARKFTAADFLKDHPKGALGKTIAAAQTGGTAATVEYLSPPQQALAGLIAERDGVAGMRKSLDEATTRAWLDVFRRPWRRIVTTGMGKPGYLMRYLAVLLNELDRPAFYLHPAEGVHGDLGRIGPECLVIAYSHSGETEEVLNILPRMKERGAVLIALTNNPESTLGRASEVVIKAGAPEVDPIRKAPTGSTTAALALATALAAAEIPV